MLNGNEIAKLLALLKIDYMFSGEAERIKNAKRNDEKYELLCETLINCYELAKQHGGELKGNNPDFPCSCHVIDLVLPTDDELILRETKSKLSAAINSCEELNIDTDLKGNVHFFFGFEDVYTPRET